ncbi:MAG: cytochrome c biogenesis protein ResB, partial [Candidatus Omnitrophica bacterium]|nr:cytochrome c biogenesis protein ResB [Candidatus Omnitrophota bacterium]
MKRVAQFLGSIKIAVPLLVAIAVVLAYGTLYEARFGTAAVQRTVYTAWWFHLLLAFLAFNLALAAWQRYPWKRHHAPFVLAHIGIILILTGGIIGGRFGVEGQLFIPEGQASRTLETPGNVLVAHLPNPGVHQEIPVRFETQAWVHEPRLTVPLRREGRHIEITVDRYFPDAVVKEEVAGDGAEDNPAVEIELGHDGQQERVWLLARDAERFGMGWGEAHVLLLQPQTDAQREQLLGRSKEVAAPRGVVSLKLPGMDRPRDIAVPEQMGESLPMKGTPYTVTFKDYFPDFAIGERGLMSRSQQPNNPAVSFTLAGPEGSDAYLLFARHPEFQSMHGFAHVIAAEAGYAHAASAALPPNGIVLVVGDGGRLAAVLTDEAAARRQVLEAVEAGTGYTHPTLGYTFQVAAYHPRARLIQQVTNRSDDVRAQAIHLTAREGARAADTWVFLRGRVELPLGDHPLTVEFRPGQRELPFTIKLLDFRKIDYPGTQMAKAFESDVELTDAQRGL